MNRVIPQLAERIAYRAGDRESGASTIAEEARLLLAESFSHACTLEVAAGLCRAQPAMAPIWNASITALMARETRDIWNQAFSRWSRSGTALTRVAVASLDNSAEPLRLVTCSMSGAVLRVIQALNRTQTIHVSCCEGRPALEGRRLASALAADGIGVSFFTDAAVGEALGAAHAVIVGADAIGPGSWINKVGTSMLTAAAHYRGVPVHVLATRDKLAMPALWPRLARADASPAEVWDSPPSGIEVRNPYFEAIPIELATTVITDVGELGADMVREACASLETAAARQALAELLRAL
jgi:translation initiation factor 2B subunit (eIF-2B alpha/beta/delta family)